MIGLYVVLLILQGLIPAGVAAATGVLLSQVHKAAGGLSGAWLGLALFGGLIVLGYLIDVLVGPVQYLVVARVNGAHRAEVSALASGSAQIAVVEDERVKGLIRLATADPQNWSERTPGDGAVAQLNLLTRYVGAVAACAVLVEYAWWPIPVIAASAWAGRAVRRRQWLGVFRQWAIGVRQERQADYWREVALSPAGAKELRVFGFGDWLVAKIQGHILAMYRPLWALGMRVQRQQTASFLLMAVPLGLVYAILAGDAAGGRTTVAVEAAVLAATVAVYQTIGGMSDAFDIEGALPVIRARQELAALLVTEPVRDDDAPVGQSAPAPGVDRAASGASSPLVAFEGLAFGYPGSDQLVLQGVDLQIHPDEMLAIVGLNGAGKSTLIKLLCGLYEPTAGRITADGVDIRELGSWGWRSQIAVVFQDFIRYHLSADENVRLGHRGIVTAEADLPDSPGDLDDRAYAVEQARIGDFLADLPQGWSTPLSRDRTGGVDLSGGQWQKVALARALYATRRGARLLVLDEPTAHLDVRSEAELFGLLTTRSGGGSIVLISHRLSTVRQADRIVLLDGGRITESGSHDELMAAGGTYARMFTIQAQRFQRGYADAEEEAV